jgi:class 3 adenylate cyclase
MRQFYKQKQAEIAMDEEVNEDFLQTGRGSRTRIWTIMLVDIVGYSKWTSNLGRETFDQLHDVFDNISLPIFEKYGGRVVKKMGDSFLVVFDSATDSLYCGIELQAKFAEANHKMRPTHPLMIKVALHTGEVIIRSRDIYGDAVNLVSRLEKVVQSGEVYFTHSVFMAMNKNEIPFTYLGMKKFRGIKAPIKIFKVRGLYGDILRGKYDEGISVWAVIKFLFWLVVLGAGGWYLFNFIIMYLKDVRLI